MGKHLQNRGRAELNRRETLIRPENYPATKALSAMIDNTRTAAAAPSFYTTAPGAKVEIC
jgi:hypothetical protein